MPDQAQAELRRKEATRAFIRYAILVFIVLVLSAAFTTYAIRDAKSRRADAFAIRMEYCNQLETLKADNRADVEAEERNYKRNLRLLHLKDSPELRKAAEETWNTKLRHNAKKKCPYKA